MRAAASRSWCLGRLSDELSADIFLPLPQASCILRFQETLSDPKEPNPRPPTFLYRESAKGLRVRRCWGPSAAARVPENLP